MVKSFNLIFLLPDNLNSVIKDRCKPTLLIYLSLVKIFCMAGCCTSCAVRIKSGEIRQPEALGISAELKSKACLEIRSYLYNAPRKS